MSLDIEEDDLLNPEDSVEKSSECIEGKFHSGFISGWEDDTEGILEDENPHETPEKEMLWAAENGKLELVKTLIQQNKMLCAVADRDGYTPLHRACYNNHVEVAKVLLDNGADMYALTNNKWTPFHSACHWNSAECVALLLTSGIDINIQSCGGTTALHLAAANKKAKATLELLLTHPDIDTSLLNDSHETAYDVAVRSGRFGYLFEMTENCFHRI